MKRTRNRESKVRERVDREAHWWGNDWRWVARGEKSEQTRKRFILFPVASIIYLREPVSDGHAKSTRLETRTKECIYSASWRVFKPFSEAKAKSVTRTTSCATRSGDAHLVLTQKEHCGYDPKDGELCLTRAKPEETLVEARRDSDVQIDLHSWV